MGRNTRRRPTGARRATSAAIALILGGGGLVVVNVYASATEAGSDSTGASAAWPAGAATIDCPDVGSRLTEVPEEAKADVDGELATLDEQIAAAYQQLQDAAGAARQDGGATSDPDGAIVQPLEKQRAETIERIAAAIDRVADRPQGLDTLADCTLRGAEPTDGASQDGRSNQGGQDDQGGDRGGGEAGQPPNNGGQAGNGPVAADYADVTTVQPNAAAQGLEDGPSSGTFSSECGVNANGLFNSDNVIVAPGVSNGAHHFHDYIGNQSNNAFADDEELANADTSCADKGDRSTYYWPVLRLQNGKQEQDAAAPGGGVEGNAGEIVTPKDVTLTFVGNPRDKVTDMPRLLRIITGDAKAFVNGTTNANASWSCTGFEDRQLKDKYPLCPDGSDVVRTFRFQSCWDGRNIDSANHRTHVAFAAADGTCPEGFRAIPQLVQRIVYDVDRPSVEDGGRTAPLFAVDSFPEQLHKPVTDHGDFINVFDEDLMREMVDCINEGRECGPDAAPEPGDGAGEEAPQQPTETPVEPADEPTEKPAPAPETSTATAEAPQDGTGGQTAAPGGEQTAAPAEQPDATRTAPAAADSAKPTGDAVPRAATTAPATARPETADGNGSEATASAPAPGAGDVASSAPARTEPQAQGGLAETGAGLGLWPAAAGGVLLVAGCLLLLRTRRRVM